MGELLFNNIITNIAVFFANELRPGWGVILQNNWFIVLLDAIVAIAVIIFSLTWFWKNFKDDIAEFWYAGTLKLTMPIVLLAGGGLIMIATGVFNIAFTPDIPGSPFVTVLGYSTLVFIASKFMPEQITDPDVVLFLGGINLLLIVAIVWYDLFVKLPEYHTHLKDGFKESLDNGSFLKFLGILAVHIVAVIIITGLYSSIGEFWSSNFSGGL